jgi:hypothetical protein
MQVVRFTYRLALKFHGVTFWKINVPRRYTQNNYLR